MENKNWKLSLFFNKLLNIINKMSYSESEIKELMKTSVSFTFPISEGIVCKV